jgi:cell division inhibitor SulA/protein ImuA
VKLSRLLLVRAPVIDENLWACEQALRAASCGAVMAWLNQVHERAIKRLQLAAETSGALVLLFRSARSIPASPAALRLHVSRSQSRTVVRILKRRGGGMPPPVALDLHGALVRRNRIKSDLAADTRRSTPIKTVVCES